MLDNADTIVLHDELAYQDVLPLAWSAQPGEPDASLLASIAERNVRVLQACVALEEHGVLEKTEETASIAPDLLRIETKINLLLDVVGQLLAATRPRPPAASVRFNALGAAWAGRAPLPRPAETGWLDIYLRDCLSDPLRLVGRITHVSGGEVQARFHPPGEAAADLIEKLAFRSHRRRVADSRRKIPEFT